MVNENEIQRYYLRHLYQIFATPHSEQPPNVRILNKPDDPEVGHYVFKNDWRRDPKTGTMYFINQQALEAQK